MYGSKSMGKLYRNYVGFVNCYKNVIKSYDVTRARAIFGMYLLRMRF